MAKKKLKFLSRNKQPMTLEHPDGKLTEVPADGARLEITAENMERARRAKEAGSNEDIPIQITLDPKKPKRLPIMADRLLASPVTAYTTSKKQEEFLRDQLLQAKRFVLDADGTRYLGRIVRDNPKMIARNIEFALQPFPKMYVELPFDVFYKEATGRESDAFADRTYGVLFIGPKVYMITEGSDLLPIFIPWYYWLNHPWDLQRELQIAETMGLSRMQIDNYFWGEAYDKLGAEEQRTLRAYHSLWMVGEDFTNNEFSAMGAVMKAQWKSMFDTSAGDLRNIVALLLLLNRSGDYVYEEQFGPHRAMYKAKPRTFLAHSVVRFRMDPVKRVIRTMGIGGAWRREHDVKGHFCHDERARGAQGLGGACARDEFGEPQHDWKEYDVNQWRCLKCGGLRWWRKDCRRGTRDKGKVKTIYEVTARV
jgi:hypothetical protein